jgi:hypothetical protein
MAFTLDTSISLVRLQAGTGSSNRPNFLSRIAEASPDATIGSIREKSRVRGLAVRDESSNVCVIGVANRPLIGGLHMGFEIELVASRYGRQPL